MFDIFTDPARAAIMAAQAEAHERADAHLGCEHLLLGLLREGGGRAAAVLADRGVTTAAVRAALDDLVGAPSAVPADDALATLGIDLGQVRTRLETTFGPDALAPTPTPFDAGAKEALQTAVAEAGRAGLAHVDTEHELLGLLEPAENLGVEILHRLGVDCAVLADELRGRPTG
jgi:ATP-dependent Clp protease ATP-binding subunit ClpA